MEIERPAEVKRAIAENRPSCQNCNPTYIDLGTLMCGCVTLAYLHSCRDVITEQRVLCHQCAEELKGVTA